MDDDFYEGNEVEKASGYRFPGVVVARFFTTAGKKRYVVECTAPETAGMLHIFNGEQLQDRGAGEKEPEKPPFRERHAIAYSAEHVRRALNASLPGATRASDLLHAFQFYSTSQGDQWWHQQVVKLEKGEPLDPEAQQFLEWLDAK